MLQGQWKGIVWPADETAERNPSTGVARDVLEKVGHASVTVPSGFVRPFLVNGSHLGRLIKG
jgi:probable 2-oxoglutarate dehydrogenase E1 component DHKTD1